MMKKINLRVLIIDLEYPRHEINEPINVDTILDSFDEFVNSHTTFDIWYRTMGDMQSRNPDEYDIVLISTKVCSFGTLDEILSRFSGKNIIIGGMLATFAHEAILKIYRSAILSMGECECNLNSILRCFIEKNDMDYVKERLISQEISGVSFMNKDQQIYVSPITPCDLSFITKPLGHRALTETMHKNGLVRIEGSRGCPWNQCSFCCVDWRYGCGKWRAFPLEKTIAEIKKITANGAKTIYFTDEDFIANKQHFISLFQEIKRLKNENIITADVSFWGSTSVYTLSKFGEQGLSDFLTLAAQCNINVLFLGIESGCDEQLKRYSKGIKKEDNLSILKKLRDGGITVDVGFIMFDSETNLHEVRENLDFCIAAGLHKTISRLAKPIRIIPHTKIFNYYEKFDLLTGCLNHDELTYPYKFKDQKVQTLFDSLNYLHTIMLDKANKMQADVRMGNKYDDTNYIEELLKQRNYEFDFIKKFVDCFFVNNIDECILDKLVSETIQSASI